MKKTVKKGDKIALCRMCKGSGYVLDMAPGGLMERCPQCQGSGRVIVNAVIMVDIRPYDDK